MSSKYIMCLDKLVPEEEAPDDINLFVDGYRYHDLKEKEDMVRLECFDSKEILSIPLDLFYWMRRNQVLIEY